MTNQDVVQERLEAVKRELQAIDDDFTSMLVGTEFTVDELAEQSARRVIAAYEQARNVPADLDETVLIENAVIIFKPDGRLSIPSGVKRVEINGTLLYSLRISSGFLTRPRLRRIALIKSRIGALIAASRWLR